MKGKGRCAEKGGKQVLERFRAEVDSSGLDNVMVTPTGCSDRHDYGPAVAVDPDGTWYCRVTPDDVPEIVQEHILFARVVRRLECPL